MYQLTLDALLADMIGRCRELLGDLRLGDHLAQERVLAREGVGPLRQFPFELGQGTVAQLSGALEVTVLNIAVRDDALPESALLRIAAPVSQYHRQCNLAFAEIVTDGLAGRRARAVVEAVAEAVAIVSAMNRSEAFAGQTQP